MSVSERTGKRESEGFDLLPTRANDTAVKSADNDRIKRVKVKIHLRTSLDKDKAKLHKQIPES